MSSNDSDLDSALNLAIYYLIARDLTPTGKKIDKSSSGSNTENQNGSAKDQPGREGSKTVRWADPIETEIPNTPVKSDKSK
ncbi:uncharacterized protein F4812DRAFT_422754 [Daldinia caldariorum]|uniref:uncharacterized protein n=1 Tax=Daldinia caldariorum TaxID=326644 RepID=UPI0020072900|nr:uncharacterized protein F4812DRAFT_422754 [Daldinia caldariorum]KAI1469340.1 hypothetical protein F4812DRAFT_422754 [Daldinia caldariorum]